MSDRHNDVRFGRPVRVRIAPLTFSRGERERSVIFTNAPFEKGTEWLDDDAFPAITGWRRQHAARAWQAMQCWLLLCCQRKELEQEIENLQYELMGRRPLAPPGNSPVQYSTDRAV